MAREATGLSAARCRNGQCGHQRLRAAGRGRRQAIARSGPATRDVAGQRGGQVPVELLGTGHASMPTACRRSRTVPGRRPRWLRGQCAVGDAGGPQADAIWPKMSSRAASSMPTVGPSGSAAGHRAAGRPGTVAGRVTSPTVGRWRRRRPSTGRLHRRVGRVDRSRRRRSVRRSTGSLEGGLNGCELRPAAGRVDGGHQQGVPGRSGGPGGEDPGHPRRRRGRPGGSGMPRARPAGGGSRSASAPSPGRAGSGPSWPGAGRRRRHARRRRSSIGAPSELGR